MKFLPLLLFPLILIGIIIPKSFKDKVNDQYTTTAKSEAYIELDNPFQRILLIPGNIIVKEKTSQGEYKLNAYTLFGIRIAELTMTCGTFPVQGSNDQIQDCGGNITY